MNQGISSQKSSQLGPLKKAKPMGEENSIKMSKAARKAELRRTERQDWPKFINGICDKVDGANRTKEAEAD